MSDQETDYLYRDWRPEDDADEDDDPSDEPRILAISDEMLKDLTEGYRDRPPMGESPLQYAARELRERAAEASLTKQEKHAIGYSAYLDQLRQSATEAAYEVTKRAMLYGTGMGSVKWDTPMESQERIGRALMDYARTFYIPAEECETLVDWYGRVARRMNHAAMPPTAAPFLALMRTFVAMASGIDPDELDALIQPTKKPSLADPLGQGSPQTSGRTPYNPGKCTGVCCNPAQAAPSPAPSPRRCGLCGAPPAGIHASACPNYPAGAKSIFTPPKSSGVLDPNRKVAVLGPKDDLLNPKPKGFSGASSLPFDSDYD